MFHSFGQIQIDVVLYNFAINSVNHPWILYISFGNCFTFVAIILIGYSGMCISHYCMHWKFKYIPVYNSLIEVSIINVGFLLLMWINVTPFYIWLVVFKYYLIIEFPAYTPIKKNTAQINLWRINWLISFSYSFSYIPRCFLYLIYVQTTGWSYLRLITSLVLYIKCIKRSITTVFFHKTKKKTFFYQPPTFITNCCAVERTIYTI